MKKYRIVTDEYAGFEAQSWVWYWPFWKQVNFSNTHRTVEDALKLIHAVKNPFKPKVVKDNL